MPNKPSGGDGARRDGHPTAEALSRLLVYIDERLHEPLSVSELSRRVGCSPYHFARLFRRATGQPPHEYIIAKRMEKAKQMLHLTELPIAEISRRIGFGTQAHFTATFRERLGLTPTAYRAKRDERE